MLWFKAWKTVLRSWPRAFISCKCQCLLWVLGVKRVSHHRQDERNPPGSESGVQGSEAGMQKGRWQEGKFAKFLEQFNSQDCVSRDNQHRYAEKVAAGFPQAPESARTPDTHSRKDMSIDMAANSLFSLHVWLRCLIRRCDVCLDYFVEMWWRASQDWDTHTCWLTWGMSQENLWGFPSSLEVLGKDWGLGVERDYS